nr:4-(cytidine 5'-diphospho)-2-C-methyl-D-erythritol kinase [Gammaproteobacteria bacterium]
VETELLQLARKLGADVPIFVHGRTSWAEGVGDEFTPILLPQPWYLVLMPDCQVSTREIFQQLQLTPPTDPLKIDSYQIGQGQNDFESLVCQQNPEVQKAIQWLGQHGDARLTGTGAAVFAAFDTEREAGRIAAKVPAGLKHIVARGFNRSPALSAVHG